MQSQSLPHPAHTVHFLWAFLFTPLLWVSPERIFEMVSPGWCGLLRGLGGKEETSLDLTSHAAMHHRVILRLSFLTSHLSLSDSLNTFRHDTGCPVVVPTAAKRCHFFSLTNNQHPTRAVCISTPDAGSSLEKSSPRIEGKRKSPVDFFLFFSLLQVSIECNC